LSFWTFGFDTFENVADCAALPELLEVAEAGKRSMPKKLLSSKVALHS
jgi:hypothetical protein